MRAVVRELTRRQLTVAVAESVTGGLLLAEFVKVPGASRVLLGGIVAYSTELKHTLLGVDTALLNVHGAVHPDVAAQMAFGVRGRLAVAGESAAVGIATTGVAGPDPQDGKAPGTAFVAISVDAEMRTLGLSLEGSRDEIRRGVVAETLALLHSVLFPGDEIPASRRE